MIIEWAYVLSQTKHKPILCIENLTSYLSPLAIELLLPLQWPFHNQDDLSLRSRIQHR